MNGGAVALCLVTAAVFGRALQGEFVYDDLTLIVGNPALVAPDGLAALLGQPLWEGYPYWRPLTAALLWAGFHLGGGDAYVIHAMALACHLGSALVLLSLLRGPLGATGALLAAALFALHPAHAESVGWAAALNDPLWGLLGLLTLRTAVRWHGSGARGVPWQPISWLGLALLSKETALVLLPLLWLWPWAFATSVPDTPWRRRLLVPATLVVVAYFGLRLLVLDPTLALGQGAVTAGNTLLRTATLPVELFGRLGLALVWPFAPTVFRPVLIDGYGFDVGLGCAAVVGVLVLGHVAHRLRQRFVVLAVATFVVSIALYLVRPAGLGGYPVADRYLYLATAGLGIGLGSVARERGVRLLLLALATAWAVQSFVAVGVWRDQETFVRRHLARHDDDARLWYMAARLDLERYEAQPNPALRTAAESSLARAAELAVERRWGGLGAHQRLQADIALSQAWCLFFAETEKPRPNLRAPLSAFRDLVDRYPEFANAHVGVGVCLAFVGAYAEADRSFRRALELHPGLPAAMNNLAELEVRRRG